MTELNGFDGNCLSCNDSLKLLSDDNIKENLKAFKGWSYESKMLKNQYSFPEYMKGVEFCNLIAKIAEKQNHHPDLEILYAKVNVKIWTHTCNGLTINDFILARKIDQVYNLFF